MAVVRNCKQHESGQDADLLDAWSGSKLFANLSIIYVSRYLKGCLFCFLFEHTISSADDTFKSGQRGQRVAKVGTTVSPNVGKSLIELIVRAAVPNKHLLVEYPGHQYKFNVGKHCGSITK